jgi:CRP/FNR family transcriptional regulator, cyclic AMP receptor protein
MSSLSGDGAKALRIKLLNEQRAVQCDDSLATALEAASEVIDLGPEEKFITQGSYDDDLYFIIRGSAAIETNGHRHVFRHHGCHVGEMALLDPGAGRSASVFAGDNGAVLLKVSGENARRIGDDHSSLWFGLARELSERLRGRDSLFVRPNEKPAVFIASSAAAKADLKRVVGILTSDTREVRPWTGPNIFMPSDYTLDSLLKQAHSVDFAIIIATPDDLVEKNAESERPSGKEMFARDNVFLEYGLFSGALERRRVLVLQKAGAGLASDMQGLTCMRYTTNEELDAKAQEIAARVDSLGPLLRLVRR